MPPKVYLDPFETLGYIAGSQAIGICTYESKGQLVPIKFTRRAPGPKDISIQIAKVGICHSDYHQIHNEWHMTSYPLVPG